MLCFAVPPSGGTFKIHVPLYLSSPRPSALRESHVPWVPHLPVFLIFSIFICSHQWFMVHTPNLGAGRELQVLRYPSAPSVHLYRNWGAGLPTENEA